jgi:hypothetical protein
MDTYLSAYSRDELRARVGNADQLAGIRLVQMLDGNEFPARAAWLHTGSGLEALLILDRAMDAASVRYCGKAMGWRSTVGDVAPAYYEAEGIRWLRSYFGGLVTTCGLTRAGVPAKDSAWSGEGLHGRISHIPARDVSVTQAWVENKYLLQIEGVLRETSVFGVNLVLRRRWHTYLGEKRLWLTDTVTNEGFKRAPFMLLYHCNIGYPALDTDSRITIPTRHIAPRDAAAREGMEDWALAGPPNPSYQEKVYYHDVVPSDSGFATVALFNGAFERGEGFGVYVRYRPEELPRFIQWKMLGAQDYVIGFEPSNCGVEGREVDEAHGLLDYLDPGESRTFHLEFGAITTTAERDAVVAENARFSPVFVDHYTAFTRPPRRL